MIRVGIVGASGYTGAELMRLIAGHPEVELVFVTANQYRGARVDELYPNLTGIVDLTFEVFEPSLVENVDLVFLGLPHGASMEVIPEIVSMGTKVIDLSGDFRFRDAVVYETWYGVEHVAREALGKAEYGLCELRREGIAKAGFVANPGCYPTGAALALAPLVKRKLIDLDTIIIDSKSGASGAGRSAKLETLFCTIDENFSAYKIGGKHQHTPEIESTLSDLAGEDVVVTFTPHLVPMSRGILTTAYAKLADRMDTAELIGVYSDFYSESRFVKVLPEGKLPQTKAVAGSNFCHIGLAVDVRTGRVVVVSAIDNLVKGAAGQAIQNMNLMFGLAEETGLTVAGLYP